MDSKLKRFDMDYDVVIVGSGPAGCAAAFDLCSKKRNVLLMDRYEFPRNKACAGGLTMKTLKALRYSVEPVIKRVCNDIVIGNGMSHKVMFKSKHPICAMTIRSQFDAFCLKKTLEMGASFHVVKEINSINDTDTCVEVDTDIGIIRSKYLVGADGVNSTIRKLTREFNGIRKGFAIEGRIPIDRQLLPVVELDFDIVPFGYGWIFPKDNHINVGLYSFSSEKLTKHKLTQYAFNKLGYADMDHVRGYPIGMGGWNYTPNRKRIALAGDAAGLADPLLGEGLFNAIMSGQLAAASIEQALSEKSGLGPIYNNLLTHMKKDLLVCYRSAGWFYKYRRVGHMVMAFVPVKYALIKGFALGWTMSKIIKNFYRLPFQSVKTPTIY